MSEEMYKVPEPAEYIPDMYRVTNDGHWVDVDNTSYDREKIKLHFVTPANKEIEIDITLADARDLRKELKAAITLVSIAENY